MKSFRLSNRALSQAGVLWFLLIQGLGACIAIGLGFASIVWDMSLNWIITLSISTLLLGAMLTFVIWRRDKRSDPGN